MDPFLVTPHPHFSLFDTQTTHPSLRKSDFGINQGIRIARGILFDRRGFRQPYSTALCDYSGLIQVWIVEINKITIRFREDAMNGMIRETAIVTLVKMLLSVPGFAQTAGQAENFQNEE